MVASGTLGFWGVVVSVAAGGWLADLGWYSVGRRQGPWLIDVACGLRWSYFVGQSEGDLKVDSDGVQSPRGSA